MSARAFVAAQAKLRLRGTPLASGGAGQLATVGLLAAVGVTHPGAFSPLREGVAGGLAAFVGGVYASGSLLALLVWGPGVALSGLHRRRQERLGLSLAGTHPGDSWRGRADVLASLVILLLLACVPLPLWVWTWRLGVVAGGTVLWAAGVLALTALLATTATHLGARFAPTYGGALLIAWAVESIPVLAVGLA